MLRLASKHKNVLFPDIFHIYVLDIAATSLTLLFLLFDTDVDPISQNLLQKWIKLENDFGLFTQGCTDNLSGSWTTGI